MPEITLRPKKGPNIIQRSDADRSPIIGEEADVDPSQIIGGMQSNYWGDISPQPHGFRHPCTQRQKSESYSGLASTN